MVLLLELWVGERRSSCFRARTLMWGRFRQEFEGRLGDRKTEVKVAKRGKNGFHRLLGPVESIMRRTKYNVRYGRD